MSLHVAPFHLESVQPNGKRFAELLERSPCTSNQTKGSRPLDPRHPPIPVFSGSCHFLLCACSKFKSLESPSKPGIKVACPRPCQELKGQPHLFWLGLSLAALPLSSLVQFRPACAGVMASGTAALEERSPKISFASRGAWFRSG